jgi:hypothetical protein
MAKGQNNAKAGNGWKAGIIIVFIFIVLGILFFITPVPGSRFLSTSCIAASGYICTNQSAIAQSGVNAGNILVGLTFGQDGSTTAYNTILSIPPQSSGSAPSGFPNAFVSNTNICENPTGGNCELYQGTEQQVYFQVPDSYFSSGNATNSLFYGYVWLNYSTNAISSSNTMTAVKAATLIVRVK